MVFVSLETERLILRNMDRTDREFIYESAFADVLKNSLYHEEPLSGLDDADQIIDFFTQAEPRNQHRWIIELKSDGSKIGSCGFQCWDRKTSQVEIGYEFLKAYDGQGYLKEVLRELIRFSEPHMLVEEISIALYRENSHGIKLMEDLGFKKVTSNKVIYMENTYIHDIYTYNVLKICNN